MALVKFLDGSEELKDQGIPNRLFETLYRLIKSPLDDKCQRLELQNSGRAQLGPPYCLKKGK